jgi:hypothetical protein
MRALYWIARLAATLASGNKSRQCGDTQMAGFRRRTFQSLNAMWKENYEESFFVRWFIAVALVLERLGAEAD